jgi:hypothetical protein
MLDHARVTKRVDRPWDTFERYAHDAACTVVSADGTPHVGAFAL